MAPNPQNLPRFAAEKRETISSFLAFAGGRSFPRWPIEVFLEVSNVCDLKCAMCPIFSALNERRLLLIGQEERGFIDLDPAVASLDDVLAHALNVHCVGYGESTIHPAFKEFLTEVQRYEVLADFITNGMHLTEEVCRFLVDARVAKVTVSFSGSSREEYENVYLGGKFDQVLAGISRLREAREARGTRFPLIEINSLSFQHHVDTLDRFVDLMADRGAEVIHLKRLIAHGMIPQLFAHTAVLRPEVEGAVLERAHRRARERGVLLSTEQFDMALARDAEEEERVRYAQVPDYGRWYPPRLDERVPLAEWPRLGRAVEPLRPPEDVLKPRRNLLELAPAEAREQLSLDLPGGDPDAFHCFEPFKSMYVRKSGLVKPCCFAAPSPSLGDVGTHSGSEIWEGTGFELVREGALDNRYSPELCRQCIEQQVGPRHHWVDTLVATYLSWYEEGFGEPLMADPVPTLQRLGSNTEIAHRHRTRRRQGQSARGAAAAAGPGAATPARAEPWSTQLARLGAARSSGTATVVEGHLEGPFDSVLHGWAWSPALPGVRLELELSCDGEPLGAVRCDEFRGDLEEAGKGDGLCGFTFWLPPAYGDGRRRSFAVELRGAPELWRCEREFPVAPS